METSQAQHLATMRLENNEMRQYIQHLHNDLDTLNITMMRKLKTFSLQFESFDAYAKSQGDSKDQIKCISAIIEQMISLF